MSGHAPDCPLCGAADPRPLQTTDKRHHWVCANCSLVFLDSRHFLDQRAEELRYSQHENIATDAGYQRYSEPLMQAIRARVHSGSRGLDFGCGADPVSAHLLGQAGYQVELYDPLFYPNEHPLQRRYDFIIVSEAIEHFRSPHLEITRLAGLLEPGGWLFVMTQLLKDLENFDQWFYRKDPTHVAFYSPAVFVWVSQAFHLKLDEISADRVISMQLTSRANRLNRLDPGKPEGAVAKRDPGTG